MADDTQQARESNRVKRRDPTISPSEQRRLQRYRDDYIRKFGPAPRFGPPDMAGPRPYPDWDPRGDPRYNPFMAGPPVPPVVGPQVPRAVPNAVPTPDLRQLFRDEVVTAPGRGHIYVRDPQMLVSPPELQRPFAAFSQSLGASDEGLAPPDRSRMTLPENAIRGDVFKGPTYSLPPANPWGPRDMERPFQPYDPRFFRGPTAPLPPIVRIFSATNP